MHYQRTVIFICIFFLFSCKGNEDHIVSDAERLAKLRPDSALVLLNSVEDPEALSRARKADYYLLLAEAREETGISIFQDSLLDNLTQSIEYFSKGNDNEKLAKAYFFRNKVYYDPNRFAGDAQKAIYDCLEAKSHAEKTHDSVLIGRLYQELGNIYYSESYNDEALDNYKQSMLYYSKKHIRNKVILSGKIGSIYTLNNQLDSALTYQGTALKFMELVNDSSENDRYILSSLHKSIGLIYKKAGNKEYQKEAFLRAYRLIPDQKASDINVILYLLSQTYAELGQSDSAMFYANKYIVTENESTNEEAFRVHHWYKLYKSTGNDSFALKYLERFTVLSDKIYKEGLSQSVLEIQKKYDKEVLENRYHQVLVHRLYLIIIVIVIVLLGAVAGWISAAKIRSKETELLEAKQSLQTLEQMLSNQNGRNEKLTSFLMDKLDISRKVAQMNVVSTDNTNNFIRQYNKVFGKDLLDTINWDNIYPVINDLYQGFVTKIESAYPGLAAKDLQMCCFIRAGFKTDEIAVLLNYTQNTVRVKRSRLAQKMGFKDYESFMNHIMAL